MEDVEGRKTVKNERGEGHSPCSMDQMRARESGGGGGGVSFVGAYSTALGLLGLAYKNSLVEF